MTTNLKTILAAISITAIASLVGATGYISMSSPVFAVQQAVPEGPNGDGDGETYDSVEAASDNENNSIDPKYANFNHISQAKAESISSKYVSAQVSDIQSVDFEGKDGRPVYAVDIVKSGQAYEVTVDAIDGKLLHAAQVTMGEIGDNASDGTDAGDGDGEINDDVEVSDGDGETNDDTHVG